MNNTVRFTCTTVLGNKKGIIVPDDDGYYTQPIGGLNVYNSVGEFYTYQGARQLFESSSAFMRRIKSACLKSEEGHPKPLPGQSYESYAQRIMSIDEKNVCAHIGEVWLDFDNVKDINGKPMIAIMGKVRPAGPYGDPLKKSYDNGKEDVCFSIRAFTDDRFIGGIKERALKEIITWDRVTEPGIAIARKYNSPALEDYGCEFTKEQLYNALTNNTYQGIAQENSRGMGIELFQALGWEFDKSDVPSWAKWK